MIQFYLLSVILNLACGYALFSSLASDRADSLDGIRAFTRTDAFRLIAGLASCATGLFKLLTVIDGDIPVIGDLFPSLAGLAGGFTLLLEYYCSKSQVSSPSLERLKKIFLGNRKGIGILALAAGLSHFIFPRVLFL